jgi:hypothetical protein
MVKSAGSANSRTVMLGAILMSRSTDVPWPSSPSRRAATAARVLPIRTSIVSLRATRIRDGGFHRMTPVLMNGLWREAAAFSRLNSKVPSARNGTSHPSGPVKVWRR